ncbi:MAG TPA: TolC family protein [Bacteroidetes bacterium]|nr:TolC family protein [Bacteroidota bacterium]
MKKIRRIMHYSLTPALLVAGLITTGAAQEKQAIGSLDDMLSLAMQNNPAIKAAERRQAALASVSEQVSTLPDPMLGFTRWTSSVETRVGPQENVFSLSQRIPFPGKLGLRGKIADQDAIAAQYTLEAVRRDVAFKVKAAFSDLYRIDKSLQTLDTYQELLRDFSTVAATKYATGQGIQAMILKADVEISSIIARKLQFQKLRTGVVARLNALMNRPSEAGIQKADTIRTTPLNIDEQRILQKAWQARQELLARKAMISKADYAFKLAKKNYMPDFNVQATYITIPKVNDLFADSGKDPLGFMVGMNIPIWLGKRRAAVTQAEETRASQSLLYENLRNSVEAEITDILFQIQTIEETLRLYEQGLLIQAESSLESATSAYKTGKLDFLNLLDAERMLLQLRLAYIKEQASHFKQVAALERAAGGSLE